MGHFHHDDTVGLAKSGTPSERHSPEGIENIEGAFGLHGVREKDGCLSAAEGLRPGSMVISEGCPGEQVRALHVALLR
ncbi:hypothetical protein [Streptomyces synnematoformans]